MSLPAVTIAIVSWNTRDLLARALDSMKPEAERGRADVWVVDNASEDGSPDLVADRYPWVNLVASEENLGFGRAVNLAADRTRTPWVAAANADIALRPGALDALLQAGEQDPRAGALAPRLVLPDGSTQHSVYAFPTVTYSLYLATAAFRFSTTIGDRMAFPGYWDMERARRVPWAIAAFLLFRREAWDQIGGFDDRQFMYAEDLDIGWRLREAGWATRYEPRAWVDHESSASTSQLFGLELAPHWQRATYGFIARRRGVANARAVALFNLAGAIWRWARVALTSDDTELRAAYARWIGVHVDAIRAGEGLKELR